MAASRFSSPEMPVITAMVIGWSVLCLVHTGSGYIMVSTRVVVALLGRMARFVLTAGGRTSSSVDKFYGTFNILCHCLHFRSHEMGVYDGGLIYGVWCVGVSLVLPVAKKAPLS